MEKHTHAVNPQDDARQPFWPWMPLPEPVRVPVRPRAGREITPWA